jgi:hypothetical protein
MKRPSPLKKFLRSLRRTNVGGAVEYAAQFLGGVIHPELLRSGATPEEEHRPLPGDDLVAHPMWEATRAVTIEAPSDEVWPWVAQMGHGHGGFYGWNPLEREDTGVSGLLRAVPSPRVGDVWLDGPGCDETKGAWKVKAVKPPRTLVLYTMRDPFTGRELDLGTKHRPYIRSGWTFHLLPVGSQQTRLLARTRIVIAPEWALLGLKWMGGGDTVMQRRLLGGIKARAEAAASARRIGPRRATRAAGRPSVVGAR